MRPFLEIPVGLVNSEKAEKTETARIQPERIEYYYPGFNEGVVIVMQSGQSMLCMLDVITFEAALDRYDNATKKFAGKFGNLTINTKPANKDN